MKYLSKEFRTRIPTPPDPFRLQRPCPYIVLASDQLRIINLVKLDRAAKEISDVVKATVGDNKVGMAFLQNLTCHAKIMLYRRQVDLEFDPLTSCPAKL